MMEYRKCLEVIRKNMDVLLVSGLTLHLSSGVGADPDFVAHFVAKFENK